uniref:STM4504/CBY_0614 family protein n=1 Tax=Crenothrix polyspora TaxID=360316 RepID=UPI000B34E0E3
MGIIDLFSKRHRRLRGEVPDVYQYDDIPQSLRVQIVQIIDETIKTVGTRGGITAVFDDFNIPEDAYKYIHRILCKEYGQFKLTEDKNEGLAVLNFLLKEKSIGRTLDVIELCFQVIDVGIRNNMVCRYRDDLQPKFDDAISELNARFKEHGVGFQFESSKIIRVDSEFLHTEAVKPTLSLLRGSDYKRANEEFLSAHEHYRHGRYKECLVELLKALESTMKTICQKRGWVTTPKDNASKLIK